MHETYDRDILPFVEPARVGDIEELANLKVEGIVPGAVAGQLLACLEKDLFRAVRWSLAKAMSASCGRTSSNP